MGWKQIKGRLYYYESRRVDGRPVTSYRGAGLLGQVAAVLDAEAREEKEAERAERDRVLAAEREADGEYDRVEAVFLAAMEGAGFHRRNRGPWRRKRMEAIGTAKPAQTTLTVEGGKALGRRLRDGDDSARPAFTAWLENEGAYALDLIGSPQHEAERALVKGWAGEHKVAEVAAAVKFDALRRDLAGPDPGPLETLLAGRVVFCWFVLYRAETGAARPPEGGLTIRQADFLERRLSHAHKRFLSACKALAVVRKLSASASVTLTRTVIESVTLAGPQPHPLDESGRPA